ncbi:hypothetical protein EIJ81_00375 (plasmid) [Aliivibrio salmonicida]|uniref:hypothetical protein n=1 Tax=Aliivibrio salmonicida TaxID=40269 RepID=UPI000F6C4D7F|nr:hypothetical protein [Aliivibrio salmonicida]AZL83355.1 hypothetical protein EIJ81_00375 [Aliivibrio salmonicida]
MDTKFLDVTALDIKANFNVAFKYISESLALAKLIKSEGMLNSVAMVQMTVQKSFELCQLALNECKKIETESISNHHINDGLLNAAATNEQKVIELEQLNSELSGLNQRFKLELEVSKKKANEYRKKYNELKKIDYKSLESEVIKLTNKVTAKENQVQQIIKRCDIEKKAIVTQVNVGPSIPGKTSQLQYFITKSNTNFKFGFAEPEGLEMLNDLDFHYRLETSEGVSVRIGVSEWLTPVYADCESIRKDYPSKLDALLHDHFIRETKDTHKIVNKFVICVKNAKIDDFKNNSDIDIVEFTNNEMDIYSRLKIANLYQLVSLTYRSFYKMIKTVSNVDASEIQDMHDKMKKMVTVVTANCVL